MFCDRYIWRLNAIAVNGFAIAAGNQPDRNEKPRLLRLSGSAFLGFSETMTILLNRLMRSPARKSVREDVESG